MIEDQVFNVAHNLGIALVSIRCNCVEPLAGFLKDSCGLGMQHKGDCEETLYLSLNTGSYIDSSWKAYLDPFDLHHLRSQ